MTGWVPSLQRLPPEHTWHREVHADGEKWYSIGFALPGDAATSAAMEWTRRATSDAFEPNGFWDFYTSQFEWGTHVVSLRQGKLFPLSEYSRLQHNAHWPHMRVRALPSCSFRGQQGSERMAFPSMA